MHPASIRKTNRRGFSLLEVTIGAMMAGAVAIMASGVAFDVTRHLADNIAETQVAAEARLAIESFRRDFRWIVTRSSDGRAQRVAVGWPTGTQCRRTASLFRCRPRRIGRLDRPRPRDHLFARW